MFIHTAKKTDSGYIGDAFEMALKTALNRSNADRVSAMGKCDFVLDRKHYEVKQNGGVIRYAENARYIQGSSRVIYATHISYTIIGETEEEITIGIDLESTEFFVVDRVEFLQYLAEINAVKINASRGTANIQTCYNYTKNAYHGRKGKYIEEWARDHELENPIHEILGF